MNKRNIEKLRKKFIVVASLSFFIVIVLIGGIMYLANFFATQSEIRATLNYIVENDGDLKRVKNEKSDGSSSGNRSESSSEDSSEEDDSEEDFFDSLRNTFVVESWMHTSSEFPYSLRYFAVLYDKDMNLELVKNGHISDVTSSEAERYAEIALNRSFTFGRVETYYYKVAGRKGGGTIVAYIESSRQIYAVNRLFYTALLLIGFGSLATLFLVRFFSKQIVKKEIDNIEMQDRFMTNASHELKTPLSVIKANMEVEQMLNGENEWNRSTMKQVERMNGLIQNLIRIVRAEEQDNDEPVRVVSVSEIVTETVKTFEPVAAQDGKTMKSEIAPDLEAVMREADLRQLVSLLIDNAIKYCDEDGEISVETLAKGKYFKVTVSNAYAEGENVDYSKFFERFYREDESHNIDKGGYGVGLSIAESLTAKYKGSLKVEWKDGVISFICTLHHVKKKRTREEKVE